MSSDQIDKPDEGPLVVAPFSLGPWQVFPSRNLLIGSGGEVQITHKSMEVLCLLYEMSGEVVGRQYLLQKVWPGTVVNEESLTRVISDLRRALGDNRSSLRYIETIPKRGYRLVAHEDAKPEPVVDIPEKKNPRRWWLPAGVLLVVLVWGIVSLTSNHDDVPPPPMANLEILPLTSDLGHDAFPCFNASGTKIAFSRRKSESDFYQIFIKQPRQSQEIQLTNSGADHHFPTWSADDATLAFVCTDGNWREICVVPSLGGPVQVLHRLEGRIRGLDWSPDGSSIAFGYAPLNDTFSIQILDMASGELELLTQTAEGGWGDLLPRYSPSGDSIAFLRNVSDDILVGVAPVALGPVKVHSYELVQITDLDWAADEKHLIVSGLKSQHYGVWRLTLGSDEMTPIALPLEAVSGLSFCCATGELAVRAPQMEVNLVKYSLLPPDDPQKPLPFEIVYRSTQGDYMPAVDPIGSRVAFCSDRTGEKQIYLAEAGAQKATALSSFSGLEIQSLEWSPDGSQILFSAWDGASFMGLIDPQNGHWERVPFEVDRIGQCFWSSDGQWIYFVKYQDKTSDINKIRPDGSNLQVIPNALFPIIVHRDKPDGSLYFLENLRTGLRSLAADGQVSFVADYPPNTRILSTGSLDDRLYYVVYRDKKFTLMVHDLAADQRDTLGVLPSRPRGNLALFPDGNSLVVTTNKYTSSSLMLVPELPGN